MSIKVMTATFSGIDGILIGVEIDISRGLPSFNIVGLADTSVKESKERVRSAILNSSFEFPVSRITVNLAPADLKKVGSQFDLPIAIGILAATGQITLSPEESYLFLGELSLSGQLSRIRGALPIIIEGMRKNIENFIVPYENAEECSIVKNSKVYPFTTLKEVVSFLQHKDLLPYEPALNVKNSSKDTLDFSDVMGQERCKRAIQIAAAGGHNVIMLGPPGSGKSMIAQRIPSILPDLSYEEALEVTKIYSISGFIKKGIGLIYNRPFRSPHHTASKYALIGGGNNLLPGEVTLAHNGVLFLDEMLEFKKNVLEVLRQPLEDRMIQISRVNGTICYPANLMLIGALNPCPCGYYGSASRNCSCSEYDRKRYISKLSGPLLDRMDIITFVDSLSYKEFKNEKKNLTSSHIKKTVEEARKIQQNRYKNENVFCNAALSQSQIQKYCKLDEKSISLIEKIYDKFNLSARSYSRILKVSRTIADLNGTNEIDESAVIEALQYRKFLDDKFA